jgi:hypothetical protein
MLPKRDKIRYGFYVSELAKNPHLSRAEYHAHMARKVSQ